LRPLKMLFVRMMMPGKKNAAKSINGIPAIGYKILNIVSNSITSINKNAYNM